jgi:uncharacterized protein (DUF2062 family)
MFELLRRRLFTPIIALLSQGITPKQIALGIAIGLIIGVFPVLGTTTLLVTCIALALRLNLVAVHAVHYAATPLQILLIIPFVRVGERVVGAQVQALSIGESLALIERGVGTAITVLWDAIVHAVIGWLAIAPLAIVLVYLASAWLLERANAARLKRKVAAVRT